MTALDAPARAAIRGQGFSLAEWSVMWGYGGGTWGGDSCGCSDDRCANGFHHMGASDCGCLQSMLDDAVAWRTAVREPNRVELAGGPYGLFQYVNVTTPAVLATVSTSQGGIGMPVNGVAQQRPAESVVRIEVREGWSAEVTHEDNHGVRQMVIRLVKAPEAGGG